MKKKAIVGLLIFVLIALIAVIAVVFGNHPDKIEELYNKTITSLDSGDASQIKTLFKENISEINTSFDVGVDEVNEFYQGTHKEINDLTVYHETDNYFKAYATVVTDEDSYFVCITARGSRMVDEPILKQLIVEKSDTFAKKKVLEKKILKDYSSQARAYGITVRTPGDHGAYAKENKIMNEIVKTVKY